VSGGGFAPNQTLTAYIASTPMSLGTTVSDASGNFVLVARIPTAIETGTHTIYVDGLGANGATRRVSAIVQITGGTQVLATGQLKVTGAKVDTLLVAGLLAFGYGAVLLWLSTPQANTFRVRSGIGYVHRSLRRHS
jgi:hypothetical protein